MIEIQYSTKNGNYSQWFDIDTFDDAMHEMLRLPVGAELFRTFSNRIGRFIFRKISATTYHIIDDCIGGHRKPLPVFSKTEWVGTTPNSYFDNNSIKRVKKWVNSHY